MLFAALGVVLRSSAAIGFEGGKLSGGILAGAVFLPRCVHATVKKLSRQFFGRPFGPLGTSDLP